MVGSDTEKASQDAHAVEENDIPTEAHEKQENNDEFAAGEAFIAGIPSDDEETTSKKERSRAPWARRVYQSANLCERLHEEILDFAAFVEPSEREAAARQAAFDRLESIVKSLWPEASVFSFGSFSTGLYLPASDVDTVVMGAPENALEQLSQALQSGGFCAHLETVPSARIPLIKYVDGRACQDFDEHMSNSDHSTGLGNGVHVDVCFGVDGGLESSRMVCDFMQHFSQLRPLVLLLKHLLACRGLAETFQGGVGSFLLQLLAMASIQNGPVRANARIATSVDYDLSLGSWLLQFLRVFGIEFNYCTLGIRSSNRVSREVSFYEKARQNFIDPARPWLLSITNPLEQTRDIGRNSFAIMRVREAFQHAYYQLVRPVRDPILSKTDGEAKETEAAAGESDAPTLLSRILRVDSLLADHRHCHRKRTSAGDPFDEEEQLRSMRRTRFRHLPQDVLTMQVSPPNLGKRPQVRARKEVQPMQKKAKKNKPSKTLKKPNKSAMKKMFKGKSSDASSASKKKSKPKNRSNKKSSHKNNKAASSAGKANSGKAKKSKAAKSGKKKEQ
ncbi:MAG: hypothetical protein MHM6MM_007830 [Cercozoa sp. M6MM]